MKLLNEDEEPIIRSATTYVIKGDITEDELEAIKKYCINPVDSRETGMDKPDTLVQNLMSRQTWQFSTDLSTWQKHT